MQCIVCQGRFYLAREPCVAYWCANNHWQCEGCNIRAAGRCQICGQISTQVCITFGCSSEVTSLGATSSTPSGCETPSSSLSSFAPSVEPLDEEVIPIVSHEVIDDQCAASSSQGDEHDAKTADEALSEDNEEIFVEEIANKVADRLMPLLQHKCGCMTKHEAESAAVETESECGSNYSTCSATSTTISLESPEHHCFVMHTNCEIEPLPQACSCDGKLSSAESKPVSSVDERMQKVLGTLSEQQRCQLEIPETPSSSASVTPRPQMERFVQKRDRIAETAGTSSAQHAGISCCRWKQLLIPPLAPQAESSNILCGEHYLEVARRMSESSGPFRCPLNRCGQMNFITKLCSHVKMDHRYVPTQKILPGQTIDFTIDPKHSSAGQIACSLMVVADDDVKDSEFNKNFPVLVMNTLITAAELCDRQPSVPGEEFLIIWLTSAACPNARPIQLAVSRSCIFGKGIPLQPYPIRKRQTAKRLLQDADILFLTGAQVNVLTNNGQQMLEFQMRINYNGN